jgi:hypothetical protein
MNDNTILPMSNGASTSARPADPRSAPRRAGQGRPAKPRTRLTATQVGKRLGTSATWIGRYAERGAVKVDRRLYDPATHTYTARGVRAVQSEIERGERLNRVPAQRQEKIRPAQRKRSAG